MVEMTEILQIELGDVDISRLSPDDVRAECALVSQVGLLS